MAIFRPGEKFRYHRLLRSKGRKREVVAFLSLTAMVDMFTVLVIFLLQNYKVNEVVLYNPKDIVLPKAESTKDLKPAFVVIVSNTEILIDREVIVQADIVKGQTDWMIQPLFDKLKAGLLVAKDEYEKSLAFQIRNVVDTARGEAKDPKDNWNKVTIQADKNVDFLTIKKIMYTIVEAGAGEVNFAVNKEPKPKP